MKHALIVTTLLLASALAMAAQADVVAKLGSTMTEAHEAIFSSFSGGTVQMVGTPEVFKTANAQARAAMVTAVVNLARTYSTSADFARRYARFREEQKPSPPEAGPSSANEMNAELRKGLEEAIKGLEQTVKQMPQMKKDLDPQIAELRKQLATMGTDKKQNAQMDEVLKQGAAMQAEEHKRQVAEWEAKYPVDPKGLIVTRLREFLALSSTVDFTAKVTKTTGGDPRLKFDNPAYEQKDAQWKYMYRAGKPAVDAARSLAQDWLKALGG